MRWDRTLAHPRMTSVTIRLMSAAEDDIQSWISFADADMAAAEGLHNLGLDSNALFHLQQAVEKTLKAVLLKKSGTEPPRLHSLRGLAERCGVNLTSEQKLFLEKLSNYYVESRYPGDWEVPPPEAISQEANNLIPTAREFIQWLRLQI
jgi:HEPN domain-containing protein